MKTERNGFRFERIISVFALAGLAIGLAGCSSVQSLDRTFVKAQLEESRLGGAKTYTLVFNNEEAQRSLSANNDAVISLHLALGKRGYLESLVSQEADLFIVLDCGFVGERVGYKPKALDPQQLNPDSIRYKNVAAMVGGGRLTGLLDDDPFSTGRQDLPAFDDGGAPIRGRYIDELDKKRQFGSKTSLEAAVQYTSYLTIGAWKLVRSGGQLDIEQVWGVTVVNDQFDENLKSRLERLTDTAAQFIETDASDWKEVEMGK